MCSALPCRVNSTASTCTYVSGFGAATGSTCDSGKVNYYSNQKVETIAYDFFCCCCCYSFRCAWMGRVWRMRKQRPVRVCSATMLWSICKWSAYPYHRLNSRASRPSRTCLVKINSDRRTVQRLAFDKCAARLAKVSKQKKNNIIIIKNWNNFLLIFKFRIRRTCLLW